MYSLLKGNGKILSSRSIRHSNAVNREAFRETVFAKPKKNINNAVPPTNRFVPYSCVPISGPDRLSTSSSTVQEFHSNCESVSNPHVKPFKFPLAKHTVHCETNKTNVDVNSDSNGNDTKEADSMSVELLQFLVKRVPEQSLCTDVMHIVRKFHLHLELPLHAKTFFGMPRKAPVTVMGDGKYCHFGLDTGIRDYLKHEYKGSNRKIKI